jgi:hypothetical protein
MPGIPSAGPGGLEEHIVRGFFSEVKGARPAEELGGLYG